MTEVRYTVTVYITQQIDPDESEHEWYAGQEAKTLMERNIIRTLKRHLLNREPDVDCEVMAAELLSDEVAHAV